MVTLYCAETGMPAIESDSRSGQVERWDGARLRRVPRMFKRLLIPTLLAVLLVAAPVATADEPLPKGLEGSFQLKGTNGYKLWGIIGSTGSEGTLALFVTKDRASATYTARGEVTREHVHFDLGELGEIDVAVQPTGRLENIKSECGKPTKLEGEEYVGAIAFHGEEGFTVAEATRAPLRLKPLFDLVCAGFSAGGTSSGRGLPGVELKVVGEDGTRLRLDQNHPGARVDYEAKLSEQRVVLGSGSNDRPDDTLPICGLGRYLIVIGRAVAHPRVDVVQGCSGRDNGVTAAEGA